MDVAQTPAGELIKDEDAHGSALLVWVVHALGPEAMTWHPAVLRSEVAEVSGVEIPENNFDKLMAAITIVTTDLFFRSAAAFMTLATALCGGGFHPDQFDPPDAAECAWAVTEALLLDPPTEDEEPFSLDVRRTIGQILHREGFLTAPDVLGIAIGLDPHAAADAHPDGAAAVNAAQAEKRTEIADVIRNGLASLLAQIEALGLPGADAKDLTTRLRTTIKGGQR